MAASRLLMSSPICASIRLGVLPSSWVLYIRSTVRITAQCRPSGHPDDKLGFAIGGGVKINTPFIGQGDYLQAQVNYTQGALRYIFQTPNTNWGKIQGADQGFGVLSDAVYGGTLAGRKRFRT